jgi:hypothetical protein
METYMLEQELKANTEALKAMTAALIANTAALGKGGAASGGSAGGKGATGGGKTDKPKPKHTYDQVKAALSEVKTTIDTEAARKIIEGAAGEGKKLADLANLPEKFDEVVAQCKTAIEEFEAAAGEAEGDEL